MIISLENRADKCTNHKTKKATAVPPRGDTTVVLQLLRLVCGDAISQNLVVTKGITTSCAAITGITFNGIDFVTIDLFNNAYMLIAI